MNAVKNVAGFLRVHHFLSMFTGSVGMSSRSLSKGGSEIFNRSASRNNLAVPRSVLTKASTGSV